MTTRVRPALTALGLLACLCTSHALAACPPPELLLQGVRSASRIQVEQLAGDDTRLDTPLAHVPGRTLGYEVQGLFRVGGPVAEALQRAFGRRDSYACGDAPRASVRTPGALAVGMLFASGRTAVAVVLHLPGGQVELQLEGGAHTTAPLSQAGQRRWEEALILLARETRTSPAEFYEQMLPPRHVIPVAEHAPDDSTAGRRDEPQPPR